MMEFVQALSKALLLALAIVMLIAGCDRVDAATVKTGHNTENYDGPPPERFMGDKRVRVHFTTQARITQHCDKAPKGFYTEACADDGGMYVPNPCMVPERYAVLLCHELAHMNGWPSNHPY